MKLIILAFAIVALMAGVLPIGHVSASAPSGTSDGNGAIGGQGSNSKCSVTSLGGSHGTGGGGVGCPGLDYHILELRLQIFSCCHLFFSFFLLSTYSFRAKCRIVANRIYQISDGRLSCLKVFQKDIVE